MNDWIFIYDGFDPEKESLREALCTLGNGYFATRGAGSEAQADAIHYPGTYLAGGYNRLSTEIAGRVIENEDLVNLPNWLPLNFRIDDGSWFSLMTVEILSYRQELDIRKGVLSRTIRFRDRQGRETSMTCRRLVHMGNPHLAAQEIVLTAENWSGAVTIRSALDGRVVNAGVKRYQSLNNRHLEPLNAGSFNSDVIYLEVRTNQSKLHLVQAARTRVLKKKDPLLLERRVIEEPGYIAQELTVDVTKGEIIALEKVVSLFTSRDRGISEWNLEAGKAVESAGSFNALLKTHSLAWEQLWRRFEIEFRKPKSQRTRVYDSRSIPRDPGAGGNAGLVLHLYMFHVLQTTSMHTIDLDVGVPSRGWHGEAYRGHIFWDELYIFPFFNFRVPEITRALLMYRYRRLGEARAAAKKEGWRGAIYPWQSASNGREETQRIHLNPQSGRWLPDNSHLQRHVNAAIAYNIWQYFQVTGDMEFLSFYGAEMFLEIARFWESISTYNPDLDRYEILGVMGPDEYHDRYPGAEKPGLNNNAYTNIMAVWILSRALELFDLLAEVESRDLCERLGVLDEEKTRWRDISRKMRIVFHDDGIISQFEGYDRLEEFDWKGYRKKYKDIQRLDRILEAEGDTPNRYKASKQADVLMLFYLFSSEEISGLFQQLGYPFEYETIPRNIDYYLKRTSHGSTLSHVVHSWVLARSDRVRSWKQFIMTLQSDVSDIQGGTTPEGIHLGAMAGVVDILQEGYTGLEARGQVLWLNPVLPKELRRLRMHMRYRGHSLSVEVTPQRIKVHAFPCASGPIQVGCKGKLFNLKTGDTIEIPL
ncbi:MAG: glycoside hydrolase family 65 protein [Proteobacteria bacterium]|nr:glycoside hydrolase family 65 protein [Desulfobacteraceae bacterium]MBU3979874.1 glycoside hydrolase family 65 protein [Pseudomonadota bacterium]MBU4013518.1 glycoside hydrolase family 65 protein [Pseudomonadota bacterium]MBU4068105.1 glycoside hydrolase family 65 protein [Pseudomonadota bacterium]MBU4100917.1 glycoside hydrolase family 65 protein [Pseudomonadota bacterium]